jgi:hypothetical protein
MRSKLQYISPSIPSLPVAGFVILAATMPWPIVYSSAAMILFGIISLISCRLKFSYSRSELILILLLLAYFLLHPLHHIVDSHSSSGWFETEKKLSLLFIPFILHNRKLFIPIESFTLIRNTFLFAVIGASLSCLIYAIYRYFQSGDPDVFYYHNLCIPIKHHAVYLSLQIILAWYWMSQSALKLKFFIPVTLFFVIVMLLLSSKLMIPVFFIMVIAHLVKNIPQRNRIGRIFIITCCSVFLIVFFGKGMMHRYGDLSYKQLASIQSGSYSKDQYFDGLSLRLIQQKFAIQILEENHAWFWGVGSDQAQGLLDAQYKASGMYTGSDNHSGYLGLNFHNQFTETFVRFGLFGLSLLLMICYLFLKKATENLSRESIVIIIVFIIFFMTESVLETQRGLVSFLFFNLIVLKQNTNITHHDQTSL